MAFKRKHNKGNRNFHGNRGGGNNFNKKYFKNDHRAKSNFNSEKKTDRFYNNLQETDLGILEYIGNCEGFSGIIKSRYSDFHVNEIDTEGNITILSDLNLPEPEKQEEEILDDEKPEKHLIEAKFLTQDEWDKIRMLTVENSNIDYDFVEIDVTAFEKTNRTEIHNLVKQVYGKAIISSTVSRDDNKFIKCARFNKNVKVDVREKWPWPHDFTYFIVHKENVDTMKAALMLSQNLNCKPSVLAYAGTKDKRAKTSQWFCIKRRHPELIQKAASRIPCLDVGNFTFKPTTLKLGNLNGNKFQIALRNITADEKIVNESLESMKNKGFINYYGLQRFGNNATVPTYKVGLALLKGNWNEACDLILQPREGEPNFMKEMREKWVETRDAAASLKMLRSDNKNVEAKLLAGLVKHGKQDLVGALGNIPRNMRLLYIHSYQSLIWNKVVSRRFKEWGQTLRLGDLVFADKNVEVNNEGEPLVDGDIDLIDENDNNDDDDDLTKNESSEEETSSFKALAKPLTKEDLESNKYTIFDLVLPLPGHDILYPSNESAVWYEECLAEDGLSSSNLKQKIKVYSLTGAYRKVIVKPVSLEWNIKKYNSSEDTLILSDLEIIKKETLSDFEDGKLTALILKFILPSSCYATMALREILKIDTSTSNQIKLTNLKDDQNKNNDDDENDDKEDSSKEINEQNNDNAVNKNDDKRKLNIDDDGGESIENNSKKIKIE